MKREPTPETDGLEAVADYHLARKHTRDNPQPMTTVAWYPGGCGETREPWHTEPHIHHWEGGSGWIHETRWVTCVHDAKAFLKAGGATTDHERRLLADDTYKRSRARWNALHTPTQEALF